MFEFLKIIVVKLFYKSCRTLIPLHLAHVVTQALPMLWDIVAGAQGQSHSIHDNDVIESVADTEHGDQEHRKFIVVRHVKQSTESMNSRMCPI